MTVPIPAGVEQLTPAWFGAALSTPGRPVAVSSAQAAPIGAGAGMMSNLYRVALSYSAGDGPASVIVKLPTANEQNRQVAITFDNYRREVSFYRRAADATPMRTPHAYVAESDGADRFVLVLEDLSAWEQGDQIAGCALDRANAVMDALADLHAAFWGRVDDGTMDWMPDSHPSVMSDGLASGAADSYDAFAQLFSDVLSPELATAKARYLRGLPHVQASINAPPRSVIHGDFRMDNLFFRPVNGAIEVACCDWQAPVRGKGVQDVAYFLSGSIDTELRRTHEQALIRRWVDALRSRGVTNYEYRQAFQDYRTAILMLWTYVVIIGGGLAAENQRGNNWVSAMVERSAAAMVDHECLALL